MSATQHTWEASAAAHAIPQQKPQDLTLAEQLAEVRFAADRLGCSDAADVIGALGTIGQVVFLPEQTDFANTTASARSWGAWDRLTAEDGWEHTSWHFGPDGKRCGPGTAGAREHRQKTNGNVTVFPPRRTETAT